MSIHRTAVIDQKAQLATDVEVGPYSVIGPEVSIDSGSWIGPHVVINGDTTIGKGNRIFQFASVGEASQDKKYAGESTKLIIGDDNVVRECVTIHRGTVQDEGVTRIGHGNLFMAYAHIAHDCVIGDHNIFVNASTLGGHVIVGDYVALSAYCAVHQFCKIGSYAFITHGSIIIKDVAPYVLITGGHSPTVCGINSEGLKRRGFSPEDIQNLRRAYKVIYRQGLRTEEAIEKLNEMATSAPPVKLFADFLTQSERGIIR